MARRRGVSLEREILELLSDGKPRSMREIQRELCSKGLCVHWYAIYYHIKDKDNNLVKRGCLTPEKTVGELKHVAQDEYKYKKGENFVRCL